MLSRSNYLIICVEGAIVSLCRSAFYGTTERRYCQVLGLRVAYYLTSITCMFGVFESQPRQPHTSGNDQTETVGTAASTVPAKRRQNFELLRSCSIMNERRTADNTH